MFLQVKNLPREENSRAQADSTNGMQGTGQGREALGHQRAGDVEKGHQQQDEREPLSGRKRVPVGRDEQQHARP